MALPKRRQTSSRRNKRRAHDRLTPIATAKCPQCGNTKQSHTVCPTCGFYRKREVIDVVD